MSVCWKVLNNYLCIITSSVYLLVCLFICFVYGKNMKEHLMLHHFSCFVCLVFHPTRKLRIGGFALLFSFIRGCILLFSLCFVCIFCTASVCVFVCGETVRQKCLFTFKSELDNRNGRKQWSQVDEFVDVCFV